MLNGKWENKHISDGIGSTSALIVLVQYRPEISVLVLELIDNITTKVKNL